MKVTLVNPYFWWKSQPDKGLLLLSGFLFSCIFCIGHYLFNPVLNSSPDYGNFESTSHAFISQIESPELLPHIIVILFLFLFGSIPLIPFSIIFGIWRTENDTHKFFSRIAYMVAFLYFPSLMIYRWIIYCILDGFYIPFYALFSFLIITSDALLSLSVPLVCVMYFYNRFFFGMGRKISKYFKQNDSKTEI